MQSHGHDCREDNKYYHHKGHLTYTGMLEEWYRKMEKKNTWEYKERLFYNK